MNRINAIKSLTNSRYGEEDFLSNKRSKRTRTLNATRGVLTGSLTRFRTSKTSIELSLNKTFFNSIREV